MAIKIKKERVPTLIITEHYKIEGYIFSIPGTRIVDELNKGKGFVPISDATIQSIGTDTIIDKVDFLILNRDYIEMIIPLEVDR